MKWFFLLLLVCPFPLSAQDAYLKKYTGSYSIMVQGYSGSDSEAYELKADGSAIWTWGYKDSSGQFKTQKKYGTWTAKEGFISVIINGNRGKLQQDFRLRNGRFVDIEDSNTHLKKT